jgi:sugar phosphate isomerase/epimerase
VKTIKGPAIFLAQFMGDKPPFDTLDGVSIWARDLGFKALQLPTWNPACIDLPLAAKSRTYCDELKGRLAAVGLEISELSTHLQGQLVAVHPAFDLQFDAFAPRGVREFFRRAPVAPGLSLAAAAAGPGGGGVQGAGAPLAPHPRCLR